MVDTWTLCMETLPESLVCCYCGETFTPTFAHKAKQLLFNRLAEGRSFCCLEHRRAMVETHIGHEEKHGEIPPDDEKGAFHDGGRCADQVRYHDEGPIDLAEAIGDLTPDQSERLTFFLVRWLSMHPNTRDAIAMQLTEGKLTAVAERMGCTVQNVSKALRRAARRMPEIGAALALRPTPGIGAYQRSYARVGFGKPPSSPISPSENPAYTT